MKSVSCSREEEKWYIMFFTTLWQVSLCRFQFISSLSSIWCMPMVDKCTLPVPWRKKYRLIASIFQVRNGNISFFFASTSIADERSQNYSKTNFLCLLFHLPSLTPPSICICFFASLESLCRQVLSISRWSIIVSVILMLMYSPTV